MITLRLPCAISSGATIIPSSSKHPIRKRISKAPQRQYMMVRVKWCGQKVV
jgi:hypothetical protein